MERMRLKVLTAEQERDKNRPKECFHSPTRCWADLGGSALLSVLPRGGTPRCMACGGKVRGGVWDETKWRAPKPKV